MEETFKKVRHTPGPWKVITIRLQGEQKDSFVICPDSRFEFSITTVTNSLGVDSEGNAILIAAAPSLLEALEEINSEDYDTSMSNKHLCAAIYRLKGIAYNAIKLAKGEIKTELI